MLADQTIGVVIPTFQARAHLAHCLPLLLQSSLQPKILIIDSSSTDGTQEYVKEWGVDMIVIPQKEFNHGLTREKGRKILGTSIVVYLTQDAYPASSDFLSFLVSPILTGKASISYARQLPHQNAGFLEAFARNYNYPSTSHTRNINDLNKWGSYTFFCSNSCAAYSQKALDEIEGFSDVLFGEDTIAVAKLLKSKSYSHHIAYVAESAVYHSHQYNLKQEFQRHYDMGYVREQNKELLAIDKNDTKRGRAYLKTLLWILAQKYPQKIPYTILQNCIKFLGYYLGRRSQNWPIAIKKLCSSQKKYWENSYL